MAALLRDAMPALQAIMAQAGQAAPAAYAH
jgi:hypothetical protein